MTTNMKDTIMLLALFALTSTAVFAGAQTEFYQGEFDCLQLPEKEILVLTIVTADFDGQQDYTWNQVMPAPVSVPESGGDTPQNALFIGGGGGDVELTINDKFLGHSGSGNINIPFPTYQESYDRVEGLIKKETLVEGDNDISFKFLEPQPGIKAGDEVIVFAGTACSDAVASTLPLGPGAPVEVPEFSHFAIAGVGLICVGGIAYSRRKSH